MAHRVLVIDDDSDLREILSLSLETYGYEVMQAANGQEGLAFLASAPIDLVLLDMKMPVMDGWEFARQAHEQNACPPIIVVTAAENARKRAEEIGADGWLAKPFDVDDLLQAVGQFSSIPVAG